MTMFSRDQLKRLKKPQRQRAQSAPAVSAYNSDSSTEPVDRLFGFGRRKQGNHSTRRLLDHDGMEHEHTTRAAAAVPFVSQSLPPIRSRALTTADTTTTDAISKSLPPMRRSVSTSDKRHGPLVKALVAALQKEHMLDVTLVGRDSAKVRASRYVLACRCEALEHLLYKNTTLGTTPSLGQQEEQVYIGDYSSAVLQGLVEYCFTGALSDFWKQHASHATPQAVVQILELSKCAHHYKFRLLKQETYQLSRRLMNQHGHVACLFFNKSEGSDILAYAQQTIYEYPQQTLFGSTSFVSSLSPERLEVLLQQDDDNDNSTSWKELDKVRLLQLWSNGETLKFQVARNFAKQYINLHRIHLDQDTVQSLQESQLFDVIPNPTLAISMSHHDKDCTTVERVLVEGAGMESVNGWYHVEPPQEDEEEELMYISNDASGSMTLYCWNGTWHIAASIDLSNSLYKCEGKDGQVMVPRGEWQAVGAVEPAPTCTWMPALCSDEQVPSQTTSIIIHEECSFSDEELLLPACVD